MTDRPSRRDRVVALTLTVAFLGVLAYRAWREVRGGGGPAATLVTMAPLAPAAVAGGPLLVIDAATHRLPNKIVLPAIAVTAVLAGLAVLALGALAPAAPPAAELAAVPERSGEGRLIGAAAWACGSFLVSAAIALVRPAALGFGDVKLMALLGAGAGWLGAGVAIGWLMAAFLAAGLAALALIAAGRANRHTHIAFGPYLIAGLFAAVALVGA